MSCMREIGDEKKCPYCGAHVDAPQPLPYLPVRTVIGNRYLVGRLLDHNGEGATYIGWDLMEQKAVNIREFLPDTFTRRTAANPNLQVLLGSESTFAELRRNFEELWAKLVQLNGLSALINVTAVIEDFGTSYAIYDHFDGISLRDFLLRSKTGYITWEKARQLLMPTLQTLGTLHKNGIIHRGISPTTLVIGEDGKIKITGFSIGELRNDNSSFSSQVFEGYAAIEQCGFEGQQGPWTDIYAFAAVLYRTLIGSDPIPSRERIVNDKLMVPGKFAEMLPAYVINALINALQILAKDRTRTVEQLRAELSASPVAPPQGVQYRRDAAPPQAPINQPPVQAPKPAPAKKTSPGKIIGITTLITVLLCLIVFVVIIFAVPSVGERLGLNKVLGREESTSAVVNEEDEYITIPNLVSRSSEDVQSNGVFKSNFRFEVEYINSDDVPSGIIISQSPDPEIKVKKGTTIHLVVSKGKEKVAMIEVVGKKLDDVKEELTNLGFDIAIIEYSEGYYAEGEIIRASLDPGTQWERGQKLTLMVYVPSTEEATTDNGETPYETDETEADEGESTTAESTTSESAEA